MAAEVLGARVDNQIEAHGDGFATPRRREGVVHYCDEAVLLGNRSHGLEVAHLEDGVGQRLHIEYLGVLLNGCLVRRRVPHISHRDLDAESWEVLSHESVCAAVAVGARNHVVVL